jgi:Immunoglobulin I-set domain
LFDEVDFHFYVCVCVCVAAPVFRHINLLPRDLNVTEGESVNLHCGAYAEPDAEVVWMQNGVELDRKSQN